MDEEVHRSDLFTKLNPSNDMVIRTAYLLQKINVLPDKRPLIIKKTNLVNAQTTKIPRLDKMDVLKYQITVSIFKYWIMTNHLNNYL